MPLAVEFAVVCGCCTLGLGTGGGAIALPIRDFGLPFGFTSPPLMRASNLLAKKLAVLEKLSCLQWLDLFERCWMPSQ